MFESLFRTMTNQKKKKGFFLRPDLYDAATEYKPSNTDV